VSSSIRRPRGVSIRSIASRNHQLFYVPKGDDSDVTLMGIDPAQFPVG